MANPSISSVTIDGQRFNALSIHLGVSTSHAIGMPMMGSLVCAIEVTVDMHDTTNMPFGMLTGLFKLATVVTKESIKPIKLEFWTDETQSDAICSYSFLGWISHYSTTSGTGANHTLNLSLQPALDEKQFIKIDMGN